MTNIKITLCQKDLNHINDYLEIQLEKFRESKINNDMTESIKMLYRQLPISLNGTTDLTQH